jgi:outer membrane receptor for ferrienterochelin and colicin
LNLNPKIGRSPGLRLPRQFPIWIALPVIATTVVGSVTQAADEQPPVPDSLEAIVVESQKLTVETLIDRKVYTVTSDAQSTFGTLSDILGTIPSVDVDPTGIVSLRGDTKVLILIDGKPSSQFDGASAGDNLQSIPAKDIERIEVLTTPPAQFKADGVAGVINIITRKQPQGGTSGSLQAGAGSGGANTR